jgi:hypothetical protein
MSSDFANPVIAIPAEQSDATAPPSPPSLASLLPSPKSIHKLWMERTHGIGGPRSGKSIHYKRQNGGWKFHLFKQKSIVQEHTKVCNMMSKLSTNV